MGKSVKLEAEGSDLDFWTRPSAPTTGRDEDDVTFEWSVGNRVISNSQFVSWTARDVAVGTVVPIKLKISDKPKTIQQGDDPASNRDDEDWTGSVEVEVVDAPSIYKISIPTNPITSGANNSPASSISLSAGVDDPKNLVQRAEWNAGSLGSGTSTDKANGFPWTLSPVPFDAAHGEHTVTCTIFWGTDGRASYSKKFKLFFDKRGHDEDTSTDRGFASVNDATPVSPPNWYDHWKTLIPKMDETYYSESSTGFGAFFNGVFLPKGNRSPNLPRGTVVITPGAAISKSNGAPPYYVYSPNGWGIDACGMVVTHEFAHKELHEKSWGGYADNQIGIGGSWIRSDPYDKDRDGIKDSWEEMPVSLGGWGQPIMDNSNTAQWSTFKYWRNLQYDGNAFQSDNEFYADMEGGRKWKIGSMDPQDWANPGKQTDPPGY